MHPRSSYKKNFSGHKSHRRDWPWWKVVLIGWIVKSGPKGTLKGIFLTIVYFVVGLSWVYFDFIEPAYRKNSPSQIQYERVRY